MDVEDVGLVLPMGAMIGDHVTPIDHMYFQPTVFRSAPDTYPVYANADGIIEEISSEPLWGENRYRKYRLVIRHTCDFYSIYNLLTSLSPEIEAVTGPISPGGYYAKPIPVKQGELIGRIGGQTLDLSVNYDEVSLGFIVPEHYEAESWKIHTVDPFDYLEEPDKSRLLAKNLRQADPRGGKIDYDIDGRLAGNWFVMGTGGYRSLNDSSTTSWKTHAAFAYDPIDPTQVIISLGSFPAVAQSSTLNERDWDLMQFSVKGNAPDPKDVSVAAGLVKYELVETSYVHGNSNRYWNRMDYANDIRAKGESEVKGVLLVQLVSDRELNLEIFPAKTASQVTGFVRPTAYER